jgi:hypothetical protein
MKLRTNSVKKNYSRKVAFGLGLVTRFPVTSLLGRKLRSSQSPALIGMDAFFRKRCLAPIFICVDHGFF